MNATQVSDQTVHLARTESSYRWLAGGSMMGSLGGIGAIILGIIGLAGVIPAELAGIAAIVVGASLLLEGGTVMSNLRHLVSGFQEGGSWEIGTMSAEFFGGLAGVVLGILSLLGIYPETLLSVTAIVFGATLLLSASSIAALSAVSLPSSTVEETGRYRYLARAVGCTAASGQAFIGLASLVLGILAVIGTSLITLTLVAFLCVGCGIVFSGSALSARTSSWEHTSAVR